MSILQNHIKYYVISSKMGKPALILGYILCLQASLIVRRCPAVPACRP